MTLNVELLVRTLAHIEAHPDEWNQGQWRCKTGMCFAGWAVTLQGAQWAYPETAMWDDEPMDPKSALVATGDDPAGHVEEGLVHVEDRASRLLGIDAEEAKELFGCLNTLDDLRRIVADLKAGAS